MLYQSKEFIKETKSKLQKMLRKTVINYIKNNKKYTKEYYSVETLKNHYLSYFLLDLIVRLVDSHALQKFLKF